MSFSVSYPFDLNLNLRMYACMLSTAVDWSARATAVGANGLTLYPVERQAAPPAAHYSTIQQYPDMGKHDGISCCRCNQPPLQPLSISPADASNLRNLEGYLPTKKSSPEKSTDASGPPANGDREDRLEDKPKAVVRLELPTAAHLG